MSKKPKAATGAATALLPRAKVVLPSALNAFPLVLGGWPIQQLPLPREHVPRSDDDLARPKAVVGSSDLAAVRAKFKSAKTHG